jgi:hypothetical protein
MLAEAVALYDVRAFAPSRFSDSSMIDVGQLMVLFTTAPAQLPNIADEGRWVVECLGTMEGTNYLGAPISIPAVKFWGGEDLTQRELAARATERESTTVVPAPGGVGASTPAGGAAMPLAPGVQRVIDYWVSTTRSLDAASHSSLYDDTVAIFYLKRNLNKSGVAGEITNTYKTYSGFPTLNLSSVSWLPLSPGVVQVQFDKDFDATKRDGGSYQGRVHSELTLRQTSAGWRIVGERDTKIYWTKRVP